MDESAREAIPRLQSLQTSTNHFIGHRLVNTDANLRAFPVITKACIHEEPALTCPKMLLFVLGSSDDTNQDESVRFLRGVIIGLIVFID